MRGIQVSKPGESKDGLCVLSQEGFTFVDLGDTLYFARGFPQDFSGEQDHRGDIRREVRTTSSEEGYLENYRGRHKMSFQKI